MQIAGKIAIVTGGAQGLGKAFTQALLRRGAKVCMIDVNQQQGEATLNEFTTVHGKDNATFTQCDVRIDQDVRAVFERVKNRFGRLDIVVNNAGISHEGEWEKCVDVNLKGVIRGTLYGLELMRTDKGGNGGVIVNVASTAGLMPVFFVPAYTASKYGVVGYTRSWAEHPDIKKAGVKLTCLCPAFTNTDILKFTPDSVIGEKYAIQTMNHIGVQEVDAVVQGFLRLIEEENNNGGVMTVVKGEGSRYIKYRTSNL